MKSKRFRLTVFETDSTGSLKNRQLKIFGGLIAILPLVALLVLAGHLFAGLGLDPDKLALQAAAQPPAILLLWFLGAVLFTAAGLPRQLVAFVCGYVFGVWQGVTVSLIAALLGCMLAYYIAKLFLSPWLNRRYRKFIVVLENFVKHDVFMKVIVIRLQPFGTNLLTNVCAGVARVKPVSFFSASAVGYIPQMLVFALAGDGIRLGENSRLLISGALLLVSLVLAAWLWRRHQVRRATIDAVQAPGFE